MCALLARVAQNEIKLPQRAVINSNHLRGFGVRNMLLWNSGKVRRKIMMHYGNDKTITITLNSREGKC